MRKLFLLTLTVFLSTLTQYAFAMCPLCVAGAAAGLGIARYYGVDDAIIGLWLGAFTISMGLWIKRVVNNRVKKQYVPYQSFVVAAVVVVSTILPFYLAGYFKGMPVMSDEILGVNKVLFGTIVGGVVFYLGTPMSNAIKRKWGKVIPYQSTIITLALVAIFSLLFWYISIPRL